jgi:MscS family membrane protein
MRPVRSLFSLCACMAALIALFLAPVPAARAAEAADPNPLHVADMSSPRATLEAFLAATDTIYTRWADLLVDYFNTGTLYLSAEQQKALRNAVAEVPRGIRVLDLSSVPPILHDTLGIERAVQLREVLDRIALPSPEDIPDAAAMAARPTKRWRLPNTEIEFVQIQDGPRAGDYVLSPDTVERLPEFYQRVKDIPYKPGPAGRLAETYHRFAPGSTGTLYDIFIASPVGLSFIIPLRWMLAWPSWTHWAVGGMAVWQWAGLVLGGLFAWALLWLTHRLAVHLAREPEDEPRQRGHTLPLPIGILIVAGLLSPKLCRLLHISGTPRILIAVLETTVQYLSLAWLGLVVCALAGEIIVGAEKLGIRSLDGQLIRLASRLFGAVVAIGCLIRGADELGIPAYSVLAGLGVGGLAVALAAKDSLANLLGSMLIMFEKPFRVGHYIRVGGTEGTVENVGFRSTRIRTLDNSLVSIPNDSVINTTVENLSLRPKRRQRFTVGVTYDTPRDRLEAFIDGIRAVILEHPLADKDTIQISFFSLADSSLDILLIFHLLVTTQATELTARHEILMGIVALAERMGVAFAFPTRTVVIEGAKADAVADHSAAVIPLRS